TAWAAGSFPRSWIIHRFPGSAAIRGEVVYGGVMLTRDGGRFQGIGAAVLGVALLVSGCSGDDRSSEGPVTVDVTDAASGPDGGGSSTGVDADGPDASDQPSDPVPERGEQSEPERPAAM